MSQYVLNFEMEYYGPYYSEDQANYAKYIFAKKYPTLAEHCLIQRIDLDVSSVDLIDPRLLH